MLAHLVKNTIVTMSEVKQIIFSYQNNVCISNVYGNNNVVLVQFNVTEDTVLND